MAQRPKASTKLDDPAEYERFLETAKKADASKDTKAFDEVFKTIISSKKVPR